jgi:hypothetical protein
LRIADIAHCIYEEKNINSLYLHGNVSLSAENTI